MDLILPLTDPAALDPAVVGGKAAALARMANAGLAVPASLCLTVAAYDEFVVAGRLQERIAFELGRKDFADMRWEEIWDAALRIRNIFLRTPVPKRVKAAVAVCLEELGDARLALRSSAPAEDGSNSSFAGLHESYINVRGYAEVMKHVRLVWASLWSDAALLYRQELGLDPAASQMAVLIQELVDGDRSGISFSRSPNDPDEAVVEAVYGLNQGLVDGEIEPDRWRLRRDDASVVCHDAPVRENCLRATVGDGVRLMSLTVSERETPPLSEVDVQQVFGAAMDLENKNGSPQDVEWTFFDERLLLLQARPITASSDDDSDRQWYLTLRRGLDNLQQLRRKVEDQILPEMDRVATELSTADPEVMDDCELAAALRARSKIREHWRRVYWDDCIPLAHGVRLFGQVYNDMVQPDDAYEFAELLAGADISGMERNQMLLDLAAFLRDHPGQQELLADGRMADLDDWLVDQLEVYRRRFGDPAAVFAGDAGKSNPVTAYLLRLCREPERSTNRQKGDLAAREQRFFSSFPADRQEEAAEVLELGRASYRLRDDDNIYLERIAAEERRFRSVAEKRLERLPDVPGPDDELAQALALSAPKREANPRPERVSAVRIEARQLKGQPAGKGMCTGPARVIASAADLAAFEAGEILVCDAIDPSMTFLVPLAAGIVERRGGMLIHGAIIAREYGLPCVTGIPDATRWIRTGDRITIDGYLGIVTVVEHVSD